MRGTGILLSSFVLHALVLLLAPLRARPPAATHEPIAVELSFDVARTRASPHDDRRVERAAFALESSARRSRHTSRSESERVAPKLGATDSVISGQSRGERAPPSAEEGSARRIDLFSDDALRSGLAPVVPDWGGHTHRAGSGPAPGDRDPAADAREVSQRVDRWVADSVAEQRARSIVPPAWRDVERQIDAGFHPSAAEVSSDSRLKTLGKQLIHAAPSSGPTPRTLDPSAEVDERTHPGEFRAAQVAACARAFADAADWHRAEITIVVGADGLLRSARVTSPSGRAALDRAALEAVRRAVALRPIRDVCAGAPPDCTVEVRWAVDASVRVTPPQVTPLVDPITNRVVGATLPLSFTFDEALKKFSVDYPLRRDVRTRVTLLAIGPPNP